jgi:glyoxylate reductase
MYTDAVDTEFFDAAGPNLRIVAQHAVGYENIDLAGARKRGVMITNTPNAVTEGTADLAWLLILAVSRRLVEADSYARSPEYPVRGHLSMTDFVGLDLTGKTMLIVGAGRIGLAVAQRAKAWGMRVLYTARSRHLEFELAPVAATQISLDDGLREADVVSIHTPLTKETRHLIDASALSLMKQDAILVNTSRGPVVDEAALAKHLREKRIWGAGLDVFEREPNVHPDLIPLKNVILTPHIGSASRRWRLEMSRMCKESIAAALSGEEPPNRIA